MKKLLIIVCLSMMVLSFGYAAQQETFVRLPVRVLSGNNIVDNLTKDDFNLYINGKKKEIVQFIKNNRSLQTANNRRNFVLAFNISEYDS